MTLRVLVLTPRGRGGVGGIDRLTDMLRLEAPRLGADMRLAFATTRGRSIWLSPFHMATAALRIVAGRMGGRLDVVHIQLAANASAYRKAALARLCRALALPYVLHLHGADFANFWPVARSPRRGMIDRMFMQAAAIVVLGEVWAELVRTRLPHLTAPLHIVPNASPVPPAISAARDPADAAVRVLFLGELGRRKGVPLLLQALATMRPRTPWRATLAGEGAVAETRRAAAEAGLAERVDVPGWVGPWAVERLLAESDILVLPSYSENLPMAVIEAMAAGLAVIATAVGATPEIVRSGETGVLIPPGDAGSLVAALETLIDDLALRRRLGAQAQAFHRANLDPVTFAARLAAIWRAASDRAVR